MPEVSRIKALVAIPALIRLGVTLLRLAGELLHWSESLFNPEPEGDGSLVGIAWLVPVFGIYFAWKLGRSESVGVTAGKVLLCRYRSDLCRLDLDFRQSEAKPGAVSGLNWGFRINPAVGFGTLVTLTCPVRLCDIIRFGRGDVPRVDRTHGKIDVGSSLTELSTEK